MDYEYLEDEATADLAIRAYGKNLKEAFQNTAIAVINAMVDTSKVEEQEIKLVSKQAHDLKSLLYDFLEEIIYFHDAERVVFKTIIVEELTNNSIKAVFKGEVFNPEKHEAKNNIKAITYHNMSIKEEVNGCVINVIVDL